MKCGRHSSIRSWLSPMLAVVLASGGWWLVAGGDASAEDGGRAVGICCAWGNRLKDGVLTYSVSGDDPTAVSILRAAVQAWDDALPEITLEQARRKPDITLAYGPGVADGGESSTSGARGLTTTYLNSRRLVMRVEIGVDGGPAPVNAGAVEQIAKHELGHALGLAHANWDGDLMSPLVNPMPAPIPECDIAAVRQANSWKMVEDRKRPKPATTAWSPC
jgi:hypothetical protein